MNEHFRKLAVEAKIIPPDYVNIDGDMFPPGLNKFAESIYKDIMTVIAAHVLLNESALDVYKNLKRIYGES